MTKGRLRVLDRTTLVASLRAVRLLIFVSLLFIIRVTGAQTASAPDIEPPPEGQAAAELATYAKDLFLAGKYVEAADMLVAAYERSPHPIYLFNAAQSYRKGNAPRQALANYERFIQVAEHDALAAEAHTYVHDMQALIDAQERSQTAKLELETERHAAAEIKLELESARQASAEKQQALLLEKERAQRIAAALKRAEHPPFYKRAVFWGIVSPLIALGIAVCIALPLTEKSTHDANKTDGGSFTITLPLGK